MAFFGFSDHHGLGDGVTLPRHPIVPPADFLSSSTPPFLQKHQHAQQEYHRFLNENDDSFQSHLVDSKGDEYDPYSLSWRYLGVYIDCDVEAMIDGEDDNYDEGESPDDRKFRRRLSGSNDDGSCSRKLLWSAYVDRRYRGGEIGEYKFFDPYESTWDASTCRTMRCARMDCHEPRSHFRLVGVFKETDGMYDWTEQLFKHEGYCVWNDDDMYEAMETQMEKWPTECTKLYLSDSDGNDLYYDVKPLPGGNITISVYYDEMCIIESPMSYPDYIQYYYSYYASYYGYNSDKGKRKLQQQSFEIRGRKEDVHAFNTNSFLVFFF